MDSTARILVLLAASPFVVLALHVALSRLCLRVKPAVSTQIVCVSSVLVGHVPMGALLWYFVFSHMGPAVEIISATAYCVVVYNALGYSYFHLFNMSETGRRIRILHELHGAGRLVEEDIAQLYDARNMLDLRIERLLSLGQIKLIDGRYVLEGKILYRAAGVVEFWSRLTRAPSGPKIPL